MYGSGSAERPRKQNALTAVAIQNPRPIKLALRSFDISWVDPDRAEYYLGDRANAGVTIVDTTELSFKRTIGGFVGVVLNAARTAGRQQPLRAGWRYVSWPWLYAGDGDSTLKVIDLNRRQQQSRIKQSISTGGTTRVDEMALTTDGKLLLAANNAEDPPFGTLFSANGDAPEQCHHNIREDQGRPDDHSAGSGLSIEQPAWDPKTATVLHVGPESSPTTRPAVNFGQLAGAITCDGGLLVIDPRDPEANHEGAFDPTTNTGVVPLHACWPNGATVGPHDNVMLGCTPGNNPSNGTTLVINAKTTIFREIGQRRHWIG